MTPAPTQGDVLTTAAPAISMEEAGAILQRWFGVAGTVRELSSERDRNFHIATPDGQGYVLKFTNPAEPQPVTSFQTGAMQHVADRDPALPVPRVVPTLDGEAQAIVHIDGSAMVLRLLTYLEGTPLHAAPPSPGLMRALGTTLARLDRALADYEHPGSERDLLWDISRTAGVADRLHYVTDDRRRRMVERFVARFIDEIAPRLPALRHQVIHNDLNPHNAVVDPIGHETVTGIIDFGDALRAPLVNDLATALAYHVTSGETPLRLGGRDDPRLQRRAAADGGRGGPAARSGGGPPRPDHRHHKLAGGRIPRQRRLHPAQRRTRLRRPGPADRRRGRHRPPPAPSRLPESVNRHDHDQRLRARLRRDPAGARARPDRSPREAARPGLPAVLRRPDPCRARRGLIPL
ncbi:phosphotransferase [Azospirillum baldaniorum]|uniref:Hydroxylysine kinase n=1 Tax=Azospirillum baldaniorum TaxID=1064539 RepID=A0A9P1JZG1_9PROT|nr:phosphotransferase [Azospirillum baldaniorum]CCD02676.1 protein of unknown function [Azospirillum baldaniorum]